MSTQDPVKVIRRNSYTHFNKNTKKKRRSGKKVIIPLGLSLIISSILLLLDFSITASIVSLVGSFTLFFLISYFREKLRISARILKIESVFPDFLQLMSSNLRAGITIDRAMLLSAREEFSPLDKEILKTGRDITTGKDIEKALLDMAERIGSDRITKTIFLILSGIKSGGDVAILLEETSSNMRERVFMEKKAASSVLMYVIFISLAVAVGAPALFGLSNILVGILSSLLSNLPPVDATVSTPFTLSALSITPSFVFYFSLIFIIIIDLMASITLGLVSKGQEKEGLKYFLPLAGVSLAVFFLIKLALSGFVSGFFK